jgi:metallo-beta-lactamase class B
MQRLVSVRALRLFSRRFRVHGHSHAWPRGGRKSTSRGAKAADSIFGIFPSGSAGQWTRTGRQRYGEPTKVFDNLYYVGLQSVSAWAVTTSQGIILIDTLNNAQEAQNSIEGGLRRLRLNPADIKYIIITHAHADHYGGATYLANKFHAQLVMSDLDWTYLEGPQQRPQAPNRGPIPTRGMSVKDGDKLTLGDTTIEFYVTPPHTPGTVSLIIPLKEGGMRHVGGEWGGTAFNFAPTLENFQTYAASAERFAKIAAEKGVDVPLSNHPTFDDALLKIQALKARKAGQPHPFATGPASMARYLTVAAECAKGRGSALIEKREDNK